MTCNNGRRGGEAARRGARRRYQRESEISTSPTRRLYGSYSSPAMYATTRRRLLISGVRHGLKEISMSSWLKETSVNKSGGMKPHCLARVSMRVTVHDLILNLRPIVVALARNMLVRIAHLCHLSLWWRYWPGALGQSTFRLWYIWHHA